MIECKYVGCDFGAIAEGMCAPHFNDDLEYKRLKKASIKLPPMDEDKIRELEIKAVEEMINLEWWLQQYGEDEMPAKFMNSEYFAVVNWNEIKNGPIDRIIVECSTLSKFESMYLNKKLKELDGDVVNGTHIWTFIGRKRFRRDGIQNHFSCVPLETFLK